MTQRPAFRSIPAPLTVDDDALEQINRTLGVPALVKPAADPLPEPQGFVQDAPKPSPSPSPTPKATAPSRTKKPTPAADDLPAPIERLHVELPGYVTDALRLEAATKRTSMRHIVLRGLAAIGFAINPADLAPDGRRKPAKG
jgi:hypothetical protein